MGKYQTCDCCPYGYHIDLDFVRFCEALSLNSGSRGTQAGDANSRQRREQRRQRREQRLQRQSMEALLGLPPFQPFQVKEVKDDVSIQTGASVQVQNALQKAVLDFEETLQRSTRGLDHDLSSPHHYSVNSDNAGALKPVNLPISEVDSMAQDGENLSLGSGSGSGLEMTPLPDDAASVTSNTSAGTLQNIRDQVAVSLEKMKDLEEQVKQIPVLQVQLSVLKDEKRQLQVHLESAENHLSGIKSRNAIRTGGIVPMRDVGVTCSVVTRDVGIAHSFPKLKSIAVQVASLQASSETKPNFELKQPGKSTSTSTDLAMQQVFSEKELDQNIAKAIKMYEQTFHHLLHPKKKEKPVVKSAGVQTRSLSDPVSLLRIVERKDVGLQSVPDVRLKDAMATAKPAVSDVGVSAVPRVRHLGSSDCRIDRVLCDKCSVKKHSISVGVNTVGTVQNDQIPLSLNSLNIARSRSFDYSEKSRGFMRKHLNSRSIGCSPAVRLTASKSTDTGDRLTTSSTKDIGVNTMKRKLVDAAVGESVRTDSEINICDKCSVTIKTVAKDIISLQSYGNVNTNTTASKIPRPTTLGAPSSLSPEKHKLRRQDTYTKITNDAREQDASVYFHIDSSPEIRVVKPSTSENKSSGDQVESSESDSEAAGIKAETVAAKDRTRGRECNEDVEPGDSDLPHTAGLFQPIHCEKPRNKAVPTREMRAALKVLNDSLKKSPVRNLPHHLKNANNIVQQEWFKISSIASANPLDVEDYLDCFEEISNQLLEYIVNMTDVSGNTAMHYALSHGNFDVVSILLDSKVCNINQPNAAGYTCVMLVSLVHVSSETHRQVVRRLFQLADVNIRAKQHGQTALMLAVSHGRLETVRLLLESGADVNIQDDDGSTALMCAAEHGHVDIVKILCSQPDCDLTITDYDGSTALNIAMEAGNRDIGLLLYAQEHFSRGSSPYPLVRQRRAKSVTPTPTSTIRYHQGHTQTQPQSQTQSPVKGQKQQRYD